MEEGKNNESVDPVKVIVELNGLNGSRLAGGLDRVYEVGMCIHSRLFGRLRPTQVFRVSFGRLSHWLGCFLFALVVLARGQNLAPPNGHFTAGDRQPAGWKLQAGKGEWQHNPTLMMGALTVVGNGDDQAYWQSDPISLAPDHLYQLSFSARRDKKATGGSATAGPIRINRDFGLQESWNSYSFVFGQPSDAERSPLRLGQWHVNGEVRFAGVELFPVTALHQRFPLHVAGGSDSVLELGEGERIHHGVYECQPDLDGEGSNYHRTLVRNQGGFNSNRWLFQPGASVVYRHALPGLRQKDASVRVAINYYAGGSLRVEASRNGQEWTLLKTLSQKELGGTMRLPADWLPTPEIWVRLAFAGTEGNLQVNTYSYQASLEGDAPEAEGSTRFVAAQLQSAELPVVVDQITSPDGAGQGLVLGRATNHGPKPVEVRAVVDDPTGQVTPAPAKSFRIPSGKSVVLALPYKLERAGTYTRRVLINNPADRAPLFVGRFNATLGFLDDPSFGHRLSGTQALGVWWCESGWKVGRDRGLPAAKSGELLAVQVSAARGEYEAAQVVLRPEHAATLLAAKVGSFNSNAKTEAQIATSLYEVAYVSVQRPTDATGYRDAFPDPLPPLRLPLKLAAGNNQPLWITVYVPRETRAGKYSSVLTLETSAGVLRVPLQVQVYDFVMPTVTHLRSALGLSPSSINRYHHLTTRADQESVYDTYLENFAGHRISPYSFFPYAPIDIRFTGQGSDKHAVVDFTQFDKAAERWLSSGRFNSFSLPLRGMGGGTFHSRHLGELEGFKEGTPEHARLFKDYLSQIENHLRDKGWLAQAYTYWFDEPAAKDYEFVAVGMKRIKEAAPGIQRLLTVQPEPQLLGNVEIWCGLTPQWSKQKVAERKAAGEQVWWYICTGPKAPYVTEFIDHPGTELRLWPWQSWQYGVEGIPIWETTYWTSDLVYPPPKRQDPWSDPMSYVTGYGNPVGFVGYWGNGDGRFLYLPRQTNAEETTPCLAGPVNSVRWENLRDGMEDYEYFWLLRAAIQKAQTNPAKAKRVSEAQQLLEIPSEISQDLTHFTTDPRLMLKHRERVARMIETLKDSPQ